MSPAAKKVQVNKDDEFGEVFNLRFNPALLSQYLRVYQFNQRRGNAQAKTRGDVAGSGRKPWRQKGTGRARVGSVRNPVWRHGGVSHGPVVRDWSLRLPKKVKSKAFSTVLSQKILNSQVFYVDKIELTEGRTKEMLELLKSWSLFGRVLVVTFNTYPHLLTASANLKNVELTSCNSVNAYQLIANDNVVFEKKALEKLAGLYKERHATD